MVYAAWNIRQISNKNGRDGIKFKYYKNQQLRHPSFLGFTPNRRTTLFEDHELVFEGNERLDLLREEELLYSIYQEHNLLVVFNNRTQEIKYVNLSSEDATYFLEISENELTVVLDESTIANGWHS